MADPLFDIRKACEQDADQLVSINRCHNHSSSVTTDAECVRKSLSQNSHEHVFVADSNSQLLGFIVVYLHYSFCYPRPSAEITELFVSEEWRRAGIGSGLIKAVKTFCESHKVLEVYLRINKGNELAQQFYRHVGMELANHHVYRYRYYGE